MPKWNKKLADKMDDWFYSQPKDSIFRSIYDSFAGDIGVSPMGLGIAVRNNPLLAKILRDRVVERVKKTGEDFTAAYFKEKYPKISNIPSAFMREKLPGDLKGYFNPETGKLAYQTYPDFKTSVLKDIDTLGHELTHAIQSFRDPSIFNKSRGSYIPFEQDFKTYFNQPLEVQARQGGKTATETFRKVYSELLNSLGIK